MYYLWNDTHRQKLLIVAVLENAEGDKSLWNEEQGWEDGQTFLEALLPGIYLPGRNNSW